MPLDRDNDNQKNAKALQACGLKDNHILVLSSIYYEGYTQQEVAPIMSLTQQRVSQLHREALKILEKAGLPLPCKPQKRRLRFFSGHDIERMDL
jgi:DNA-directed RNA polymerase specialized sigma subunit